ncbi:MAG TPA: family 10 glycosylhydrolase [Planctomycetota bacterium]|nr:family 10 glycosylhydrolase [Planctomycetota bacterium]
MNSKLCIFLFICLCSVTFSQEYLDFDPSKDSILHNDDSSFEIVNEQDEEMETVYEQDEEMDAKNEFRAAWVDTWNNGALTDAQIQSTLKNLKQYGYNAVVVQIRRRGDAFYFPKYPNTEPRVTCIPSNLDVLKTMIEYAAPLGIEVHAWMTTLLVSTKNKPSSAAHVVNAHPEYLTQNYAGEKCISEGYYLDPGNPNALKWNENVAMDIVKNYDIDGIHFDYIRLPQQDSGYNPTAIARYNKEFGTTGKPAANNANFRAWRRRQLTDWLRTMYAKIVQVKPAMKVTAATFAGRSDAYDHRLQDWATWMKQGLIDANFPMNYTTDSNIYQTRVNDIMANAYNRHVYMGVGAYLNSNANTIAQFKYARNKNTHGLVLYSYAHNGKTASMSNLQNIYTELFSTPVRTPSMPWKTRGGHIQGQILDSNNEPVYNAQVKILETNQTILTDSQGYYTFLHLPEGEYHIQCLNNEYRSPITPIQVINTQVSGTDFQID